MNFNITRQKSVFVVAEISSNHAQSFKKAVKMIEEAKKCGADAVKFQTYTPDALTIDESNKYFKIKHPKWGGQTLYQLYKKTCMPWDWFSELKRISDDLGLVFFSTAYSKKSVDFLEELGVPFHKISSFELIDLDLVEYASRIGKPLVLSTGMATISEIKDAVHTAKKSGARQVILLKCVSTYPAKPEEMNLKTIPHMQNLFGCPIGISDHSLGFGVSVAAVALGAIMVEKHFTLSRNIDTPDNFFSMEPNELSRLVENIRIAKKALGEIHYGLTDGEKKSCIFRRSLFVVKDIEIGEVFSEDNVRSIRPSGGIAPKYLKSIVGKKAKKYIKKGTPLKKEFIT